MIHRSISHLLIAAALLLAAAAPSWAADIAYPPLTGRVVDEAAVLPPQAVATLTAQLTAHEQRTGQQVVVAVVKSLQGEPIEDYGVGLGRAWGIGQKGKNTGAILLVSPADRKVRIEVGYGLEGDLTDAVSSTIIDQVMIPHFKQGDMAGGIVAGAGQILRALGDDIPVSVPPPRQRPRQQDDGHGSIGSILLTFLIFGLFFWLARRRGGGIGSAILPFLIASSFGGRRNSSWGGDGGGGGFSGGGGSFGGGGASGSW